MRWRARRPASRDPAEPTPAAPAADDAEAAVADDAAAPVDDSVLGTLRAMKAALRPLGRRRVLRAVLAVAALGFIGIVALTGFSFWWTSQPEFCDRCHVMNEFVTAWEQSPHKDVNCERCHAAPGMFGFVGSKIASLQVVANYLRGNYEDTSFNAVVRNASCLGCHEEVLEDVVHAAGIDVSHASIVEAGGKCIFCHSATAHGDAVDIGSHTEPTMAACLKCHDDETAPLQCSLCHTGRAGDGASDVVAATPEEHAGAPPGEPDSAPPAASDPGG